MIRFKEKKIL